MLFKKLASSWELTVRVGMFGENVPMCVGSKNVCITTLEGIVKNLKENGWSVSATTESASATKPGALSRYYSMRQK